MTDSAAAQKAIATLVEIAEDTEADDDTRIRAACAILDLEKFQQQAVLLATA